MKGLQLTLMAMVSTTLGIFAQSACGKEQAEGANLEKVVIEVRYGALSEGAQNNRKSVCSIKRSHPSLQPRLSEVDKLVTDSIKQPFTTGYHMIAQVPSVEVFVYSAGSKERTLIFEDHSVIETRQGEATEKLVTLARELCR